MRSEISYSTYYLFILPRLFTMLNPDSDTVEKGQSKESKKGSAGIREMIEKGKLKEIIPQDRLVFY